MGVRERIVAYCRENIGCDYDYTPSGGVEGASYNCSFLTYCAYRSAGLRIPTWQGHQNGNGSQSDWVRWNANWTTDPDELSPGDLVFFGSSPYDTGHVGVSLGGWRMIDSVPNGGVQERTLYGSFVGGGWPLDWTPDEEPEPEPEPEKLEALPMDIILTIVDLNTVIAILGGHIHDLTDPEDIRILDKVWGFAHNGELMPRGQLNGAEYGRLAQAYGAGIPKHLAKYNGMFPPRS